MPKDETVPSSGFLRGMLADGNKPFRWRAGIWRLLGAVPEGVGELSPPFRFPGHAFPHVDQAEIRAEETLREVPARRPAGAVQAPATALNPGLGPDAANADDRPPAGGIPPQTTLASFVPPSSLAPLAPKREDAPAAAAHSGSVRDIGMETRDRPAGIRAPASDLAIPGVSTKASIPAGNLSFPGMRRDSAPGDSRTKPPGEKPSGGNSPEPAPSRRASGQAGPAMEKSRVMDTVSPTFPAAVPEPPLSGTLIAGSGRPRHSVGMPVKSGPGAAFRSPVPVSRERSAGTEAAPRDRAASVPAAAPVPASVAEKSAVGFASALASPGAPPRAPAGRPAGAGVPAPDLQLRFPYRNAPTGRSSGSEPGPGSGGSESPESPRKAGPAKRAAPAGPGLISVPVSVGARGAATSAFWERCYLGRLHLGRIR